MLFWKSLLAPLTKDKVSDQHYFYSKNMQVWIHSLNMLILRSLTDSHILGETENVDNLIRKCLLDTFRQTDEDFLKKASSQ